MIIFNSSHFHSSISVVLGWLKEQGQSVAELYRLLCLWPKGHQGNIFSPNFMDFKHLSTDFSAKQSQCSLYRSGWFMHFVLLPLSAILPGSHFYIETWLWWHYPTPLCIALWSNAQTLTPSALGGAAAENWRKNASEKNSTFWIWPTCDPILYYKFFFTGGSFFANTLSSKRPFFGVLS